MTKKIIFRADGSSTTGLGHLYRLFSLVEIVKESIEFIFLTHETSTASVIPNRYHKSIIPKEITIAEEPNWLLSNFSPQKHLVIADGYQFDSKYQKSVKEKGYKLIYIDDLAKEHMYADVVINHSPYLKEEHYTKEPYTALALGTQYALLRPLFLEQAKKESKINKIDSAFVCFGGADPYNLTQKAVEGLLQIPEFKNIHVVLGGAYKHQDIFSLQEEYSQVIKLHKNLSEEELVSVMKHCNFAIAPASTILYELSCFKIPILSGFYVDNQELIYKGFTDNQAIYKGSNFKNYNAKDFTLRVKKILENSDYEEKINAQKILFDNKIASRHLNLINKTMLTIGVLCSGGLGLDTLSKMVKDYNIQFIFTDKKSQGIIDLAEANNIPIYIGNPRNGKGYEFIKSFSVDVIASINYLFLIENDIIKHANVLTFNIHGSLLPKYRGRTPHVWSIINGETKAGITAHVIDSGCDTGTIIHQIEVPILEEDTGAIMLEKYASKYYPLVQQVLSDISSNNLNLVSQNEDEATYFGKRTPLDGEINWSWTKEAIKNWVRAQAHPYPGAFTFYDGDKIIIDKVAILDSSQLDNLIDGEIIETEPNIIVKAQNGLVELIDIRTEKCTFVKGNRFTNENRK